MDEKKLKARSKIERALGKIEGATTALDGDVFEILTEAVEEIDFALREVFGDG